MWRRYWLLAGLGLILGLGMPLVIGGRELLPVFSLISWTLPASLMMRCPPRITVQVIRSAANPACLSADTAASQARTS